jgi:uncharacterized protein (TIGR02145 family)
MRALVTPGNILYLYVMQRLTTLLLLAGISFTTQAQTNCGLLHDSNANGFVDIEDFLSILGLFGDQDSDGDGIYDSQDNCIDLAACNFLEVDAEFCSYPDAIGDCNGNCPLDEDGDGVCDSYSCGDPISYQGYDYSTVFIGGQCWFAENLRSENYRNGDSIPAGLSDGEWLSTSSGAVAVYGEGSSGCYENSPDGDACDDSWSLNEYGRLYNWYAVDDARGLCPTGWHVPTDGEWTPMADYLGGASIAGAEMKTTYGWYEGGNGTNSSGFSGLPGGYRRNGGSFESTGNFGFWWSSSPSGSLGAYARYRFLEHDAPGLYDSATYVDNGYSIRCIQDSEE